MHTATHSPSAVPTPTAANPASASPLATARASAPVTPPTVAPQRPDWPTLSLAEARRKASRKAPGGAHAAAVPSPCTGVCAMDATLGWCKGCYRTLEELGEWGRATEATKLAIWARLEQRQTQRPTRA